MTLGKVGLRELVAYIIRVPGRVERGYWGEAASHPGTVRFLETAIMPLDAREIAERAIPVGGQPDEIAEAVAWLLCPASS